MTETAQAGKPGKGAKKGGKDVGAAASGKEKTFPDGKYVGELRARIDRSREHPKAISILRSITHTSGNLLILDIDETRKILVENVKLKADLLVQAADG